MFLGVSIPHDQSSDQHVDAIRKEATGSSTSLRVWGDLNSKILQVVLHTASSIIDTTLSAIEDIFKRCSFTKTASLRSFTIQDMPSSCYYNGEEMQEHKDSHSTIPE